MLISIVITSYNYASYVGKAIESALGQTYSETEVIVVDDESMDNSREIVSNYADRIRLVFKSNGGQGSAFNAGFAASRGDLVMFLDSDDLLSPEAAESVAARWSPGISMISFRLQEINGAGDLGKIIPPESEEIPRGRLWSKIAEEKKFPAGLPTSGNAFSRAYLLECLPMPEELYRIDSDGYLRAKAYFAGEVEVIDKVLGFYRIHGANNSVGIFRNSDKRRARLKRDLEGFKILREGTAAHGLSVTGCLGKNDFGHLRLRLMSLCEDPANHPVAEDRRFWLWCWSMAALWRLNWPVRHRIPRAVHMSMLSLLPFSWVVGINRLWVRLKEMVC